MKRKRLTAKAVEKQRRAGYFGDGQGLYLQVTAAESKSWVFKFTLHGRAREMGLGRWPDNSLAEARELAQAARQLKARGLDPIEARKAERAAQALEAAKDDITFEEAARARHKDKAGEFRSEKHRQDWIRSLELYAIPVIGSLSVAEITSEHVLKVLRPIWVEKTETATRVRQRIEAVIAWAQVRIYKMRSLNPAEWKGNLEHSLEKPSKIRKVTHHPALPWKDVPAFMAALREREGLGARALEFSILCAARSGEVRFATWDEFDLAEKLWSVPGDRMKSGLPHSVPLSDAAVRLVKALPRFEGSDYVFTAARGGPLSDMSISAVCRRMEVDAVPHGFRSSFKDFCRNSTSFPDEVSELCLAHVGTDKTRSAYARDELLAPRANLLAIWADYCDAGEEAANVSNVRRGAA